MWACRRQAPTTLLALRLHLADVHAQEKLARARRDAELGVEDGVPRSRLPGAVDLEVPDGAGEDLEGEAAVVGGRAGGGGGAGGALADDDVADQSGARLVHEAAADAVAAREDEAQRLGALGRGALHVQLRREPGEVRVARELERIDAQVVLAGREAAQLEEAVRAGEHRRVGAVVLADADLEGLPAFARRRDPRVQVDAAEGVVLGVHDDAADRLAARVEEHDAVAHLALREADPGAPAGRRAARARVQLEVAGRQSAEPEAAARVGGRLARVDVPVAGGREAALPAPARAVAVRAGEEDLDARETVARLVLHDAGQHGRGREPHVAELELRLLEFARGEVVHHGAEALRARHLAVADLGRETAELEASGEVRAARDPVGALALLVILAGHGGDV